MRWMIAGLALATVAASTSNERRAADEAKAQAALAQELAGLTPGKPQSCIDQFLIRDASTTSYGDTLVYRTNAAGGLRYVTHTSGCTGLGNNGNNYLVTRTPSTELCSGDIATTVDRVSHFPTGSCAFGEFTPYRKP